MSLFLGSKIIVLHLFCEVGVEEGEEKCCYIKGVLLPSKLHSP